MVSDEQRGIDKEIDTLLPFGLCLQDKNDQRKLRATVKLPFFSFGVIIFLLHSAA